MTTRQLNEYGYRNGTITRMVAEGALFRVERGTYTTVEPGGRLLAEALQVSRPRLVLTGLTAYQVYFNRFITVPLTGVVPRRAGAASTRYVEVAEVTAAPATRVEGLRVALPVLAAVHLAERDRWKATKLLETKYHGRRGRELLDKDLARIGRIPAAARAFIATAAVGADSLTERDLFRVLRHRGVRVAQNVRIGSFWWDGVVEAGRVLIEVDGSGYHSGEDRGTFIKDRWKRNQAARLGYVVLTYTEVCIDEHLDLVVEQVVDTVSWRSRRRNRPASLPEPLSWEKQPVWEWHDWWRIPAGLQHP